MIKKILYCLLLSVLFLPTSQSYAISAFEEKEFGTDPNIEDNLGASVFSQVAADQYQKTISEHIKNISSQMTLAEGSADDELEAEPANDFIAPSGELPFEYIYNSLDQMGGLNLVKDGKNQLKLSISGYNALNFSTCEFEGICKKEGNSLICTDEYEKDYPLTLQMNGDSLEVSGDSTFMFCGMGAYIGGTYTTCESKTISKNTVVAKVELIEEYNICSAKITLPNADEHYLSVGCGDMEKYSKYNGKKVKIQYENSQFFNEMDGICVRENFVESINPM